MNIISNAIDALEEGNQSRSMSHEEESTDDPLPITPYQVIPFPVKEQSF